MTSQEMLDILAVAAKLKTNTRHCWTELDRKESVADHCWRISLMAMLLSGEEEFRDVDMNRVIRMCLIHDLGEAFTGDIPTFMKNDTDVEKEDRIFDRWVESFPSPQREEWQGLLSEMAALETKEARTYKSMDKLEALISHNESDLSTWLPLEYDLQFTYGKDTVAFSPWLVEFRQAVDQWTRRKVETESPSPDMQ